MYYADLTDFEYNTFYTGLNVGWLDGEHEFETKKPTSAFINALFAVIASGQFSRCAAAGLHSCEICGDRENMAERKGEAICLGNTEIAIPFEGVDYIAPSLVFHYVDAHSYLPPKPFVRGVIEAAKKL